MSIRKLRLFTAGAYEKNARDLDRLSQQGLQLRKAGWLFYEFEESKRVHRHCLDYCPTPLGESELARRKSAFEDAGWELVNTTATGWRYYRRRFDHTLPESAYESPCPWTPKEDRRIGLISLLFWLRVPVLLAGAVLAALAVIRGKGMLAPSLVFLVLIVFLSLQMQALQEKLKL